MPCDPCSLKDLAPMDALTASAPMVFLAFLFVVLAYAVWTVRGAYRGNDGN